VSLAHSIKGRAWVSTKQNRFSALQYLNQLAPLVLLVQNSNRVFVILSSWWRWSASIRVTRASYCAASRTSLVAICWYYRASLGVFIVLPLVRYSNRIVGAQDTISVGFTGSEVSRRSVSDQANRLVVVFQKVTLRCPLRNGFHTRYGSPY